AFIVCCSARKDVTIFKNRLERRRVPQLQRIGRLYVVMSVDQNSATPGLMFVARPDDWVPACRDELCLQTDARKAFHKPMRAFAQLLGVLVICRNAWEPQERIKILEIIFTHGHKLIGFRSLPTTSAEAGCGLDTESKRLREQLPRAVI